MSIEGMCLASERDGHFYVDSFLYLDFTFLRYEEGLTFERHDKDGGDTFVREGHYTLKVFRRTQTGRSPRGLRTNAPEAVPKVFIAMVKLGLRRCVVLPLSARRSWFIGTLPERRVWGIVSGLLQRSV